MGTQFQSQFQLIFVRFEQARGKTGVPKTWLPYWIGHPNDPTAKPELATLVKLAVWSLRALCADANQGHGRDLMPGDDGEYRLHNADGGLIESVDQIKWEQVQVGNNTETRADLVLTWKSPAEMLLSDVEA